jgi:predicted XRE-type DNA-binding protein
MSSRSGKQEASDFTRKTGNVFAQLGRPNADELLRKARVVNVVNDVIKRRGLTQGAAAELADMDQADISRLANGKVGRFSLDRLLTIVDRLGIEIGIEQRHDEHGHLVVEVRELTHA